jgi:hypothetical protein
VDVAFPSPTLREAGPDEPKPSPARVFVVIAPSLEQFVYVHYDPRWRRTFRIHLGTYVRDGVVAIADRRFRRSIVVKSLRETPTLPEEPAFILVPELGQIDYRTPWSSPEHEARFQARMRLRVLYSTRREAETLEVTGAAVAPFGEGGVNTPDIVRAALDQMLADLDRSLAAAIGEL